MIRVNITYSIQKVEFKASIHYITVFNFLYGANKNYKTVEFKGSIKLESLSRLDTRQGSRCQNSSIFVLRDLLAAFYMDPKHAR